MRIKISHHGVRDDAPFGTWCFYLLLLLEQFPEDKRDGLLCKVKKHGLATGHFDYFDCPLSDLEWHGGMTYYKNESSPIDIGRRIEVGCDYNHYWDEDRLHSYNEDVLRFDAERCVDSLFEKYPDIKSMETLQQEHAERLQKK